MVLDVTYKGLDRTIKRTRRVAEIAHKPATYRSVNRMAEVWQANFNSEGGSVGGWRQLAEVTNRVRVTRGFSPEHPILKQTGMLYQAAVTSLLNARGPRTVAGPGVTMRYSGATTKAELLIAGAKVSNQFRMRGLGRSTSQPARRFWYADASVEAAAARGLNEWVKEQLGNL